MWEYLLESESMVRLGAFAICLLLFSILEWLMPMKIYKNQRGLRWLTNYFLVFLNTTFLRVFIPVLAAGWAASWNGGIFQIFNMPFFFELVLSLLLLDLIIYFQHRIFHVVPLLWRLHRVHHMDTKIDTSTALRFHPIEILISMFIKIGAVLIFGMTPEAVILFEILLSSLAIFNHANWNMGSIDSPLQTFLVTPNMHRIHHSVLPEETNSNYGFCLSLWDKLFGSFTANPKRQWKEMDIGLEAFRSNKEQRLDQVILNPFR